MSGDATPFPMDSAESSAETSAEMTPESTAGDGATPAPEAQDAAAAEAPESSAATDPQARVQELETELAALRAEHESVRSQYMRIAADFDNFRKRQSRDQDDLRLQITCSTLSEILPVVDNFERARQQLEPQAEEAQTIHRSYQGLYKQLVDVFKQLGVSPMRVEGERFDPALHEAVLRESSEEHHEDVVIAELQRGYHLNGRVLRHALVKVSMGPGPSGGDAPAPAGDPQPAEQGA
ncbi:MAG: nucleotide exchange factor GrpE [Cyanobium sp.]